MQLPSRKVLSSGIVGVAAWALITFVCPAIGIPVDLDNIIILAGHTFTMPDVIGAILFATHTVAYLIPNSLKDHAKALDMDVKQLADWIPVIQQSYPEDHPIGVQSISNIKTGLVTQSGR